MSTSSKPPESPSAGQPQERTIETIADVGTHHEIDALEPLRAAYRRNGIAEVPIPTANMPAPAELVELAEHVDAILLTYPRLRSPNTVVPWPAAVTASGRRVPIGVVPAHRGSLERFADTAARVHDRRHDSEPKSSVALLAQRSRRYIDLAARIRRLLVEGGR